MINFNKYIEKDCWLNIVVSVLATKHRFFKNSGLLPKST
jgi:hypothetical protein